MRKTSSPQAALKADPTWKIGIVYSSFYKEVVEGMVAGARKMLEQAGIKPSFISEYQVAGSFEVPLIGRALADAESVDALIGLGVIVEGETNHAELLAEESARGIMDVQLQYEIPFAFEILHVDTLAQAKARSKGTGNKGAEAAYAVLHSLSQLKRIRGRKR